MIDLGKFDKNFERGGGSKKTRARGGGTPCQSEMLHVDFWKLPFRFPRYILVVSECLLVCWSSSQFPQPPSRSVAVYEPPIHRPISVILVKPIY